MKIMVRVVPRASRLEVKNVNGILKVYLTRPAADQQANIQLIDVLAKHFKTKKYRIVIVQGLNSRNKVIRIEDGANPLPEK